MADLDHSNERKLLSAILVCQKLNNVSCSLLTDGGRLPMYFTDNTNSKFKDLISVFDPGRDPTVHVFLKHIGVTIYISLFTNYFGVSIVFSEDQIENQAKILTKINPESLCGGGCLPGEREDIFHSLSNRPKSDLPINCQEELQKHDLARGQCASLEGYYCLACIYDLIKRNDKNGASKSSLYAQNLDSQDVYMNANLIVGETYNTDRSFSSPVPTLTLLLSSYISYLLIFRKFSIL